VLLTALFFIVVVGKGLRAQSLPSVVGTQTMIGQVTSALEPITANGGKVFIEGELWRAVSDEAVEQGAQVEVLAVEGLTLRVKRKN
jgi:membrane-bound serine protease (ClpP class)